MKFSSSKLMLVCIFAASLLAEGTARPRAFAGDDWPQFRGPHGDGVVLDQVVPVEFDESANVTWKTPLPGRAWSSPVVADGVIWMTTAVELVPTEDERLAMLRESGIEEKKMKGLAVAKSIALKLISVDLRSGSVLRTIDLTTVEGPDAIHSLNSYASPTPVLDGPHLYCHFGTYGTFCVDRESGNVTWQRTFPLEHGVGPGSSPFVHDSLLVLIQDGMDRQYVVALDKTTGETRWETDRPPMDAPSGDTMKSYCTPIAITDSLGRDQLICMVRSGWLPIRPRPATRSGGCGMGRASVSCRVRFMPATSFTSAPGLASRSFGPFASMEPAT